MNAESVAPPGLTIYSCVIPRADALGYYLPPLAGLVEAILRTLNFTSLITSLQSRLQVREGDVLGVAPGFVQAIEHAVSARVVERMDDDRRVTLAVRVSGEPGGDGIACVLVIRFVRKVMLFFEVVV